MAFPPTPTVPRGPAFMDMLSCPLKLSHILRLTVSALLLIGSCPKLLADQVDQSENLREVESAIVGEWIGAVQMPNELVTIVLKLRRDENSWHASLEIPNFTTIEFDSVQVAQTRLLATLGDGSFEARLIKEIMRGNCSLFGGRLSGNFMLVPVARSNSDSLYELAWREGFLGQDALHYLAILSARRGNDESAINWLKRGRAGGMSDLYLFTGKELNRLRHTRRFQDLYSDPARKSKGLSRAVQSVRLQTGVRIPMRDGITLTADLLLPEDVGTFPTILVRTPYGRRHEIHTNAHFAARGYVIVSQSVRGREDSGGEFVPWMNERQDGYDTITWIAEQPWSNGKVGMIGSSYMGQTQWAAAAEQPKPLRCIVPQVSGTDHFFDVPYDHGILKLNLLPWAYSMDTRSPPPAVPAPDAKTLFVLPLAELDQAYVGHHVTIWQRWLRMDSPAAWDAANFLRDFPRIDIPVLHISGWWDGESSATERNYRTMKALGRTNQWLIYGPWPHNFNESSHFADQDYGTHAIVDLTSVYIRWFDHWLKNKDVYLEKLPKALVFVTGANRWRAFRSWPPDRSRELRFYLTSVRPIVGAEARGNLASVSQRAAEPDTYIYDPLKVRARDPIDLYASTRVTVLPTERDVLVYQTEPLQRAMIVAAPGYVDLWFSTSGYDTDFFALLVDIDQAGTMRALSGPAKMRMRYLSGWNSPNRLRPGEIYRAVLELRPFAHQFQRGHRLGLILRSEWFPSFDRNLNTGEPIRESTRVLTAVQKIYHDKDYPSAVTLHLLE